MANKYENLLLLEMAYVLRKKKIRKPRYCIHPVIANWDDQGDYQHLIQELRSDPALFRRYFRLSVKQLVAVHQAGSVLALVERSHWSTQLLLLG